MDSYFTFFHLALHRLVEETSDRSDQIPSTPRLSSPLQLPVAWTQVTTFSCGRQRLVCHKAHATSSPLSNPSVNTFHFCPLQHHSYRSFLGITSLMQISTRDEDFIIDTLELRSEMYILNEAFTDPQIVKVEQRQWAVCKGPHENPELCQSAAPTIYMCVSVYMHVCVYMHISR